jgi:vacuolar-type H+-ATPase subunit D/Vma8
MDIFLFVIIITEELEGTKKQSLLFDEVYPILAKDEKDAIAQAMFTCAADIEEAREKADGECKEFSFEVIIRPF